MLDSNGAPTATGPIYIGTPTDPQAVSASQAWDDLRIILGTNGVDYYLKNWSQAAQRTIRIDWVSATSAPMPVVTSVTNMEYGVSVTQDATGLTVVLGPSPAVKILD